jgi:fatty acid desaturase
MMRIAAFDGRPFCRREDIIKILQALVTPAAFFLPYTLSLSVAELSAYLLALVAVNGSANYLLHLHVHHPFTTSRACNLLLDLMLGAATGITASNWRIQHVYGHHRGRETKFRAHDFDMSAAFSGRRALKFCWRSMGPTVVGPIREAYEQGFVKNIRTPIDYRWAFIEQCLYLALIGALLAWRPWLTLGFVLPWHFAVFFFTRYVDFLNHCGCKESSANPFLIANNTTHAAFNRRSGNLGFHTAHHLYPTAHWSELPRLHRAIETNIPPHLMTSVSWSFLHFPLHVLRGIS